MGSGSDNISSFTIEGCYFIKKRRICMIKKYQPGTDNTSKKIKHRECIDLKWNTHRHQFEGTYLILSNEFNMDKFELKFERPLDDVCESV